MYFYRLWFSNQTREKIHAFYYKQHFYKQRQTKIGKKLSKS